MSQSPIVSTKSAQSMQEAQIAIPPHPPLENPSAWMHDGYSPTEIILAAAVLTSASVGAIATIIMAITGLVRTLVPIMKPQTTHKISYLLSVESVQEPDQDTIQAE